MSVKLEWEMFNIRSCHTFLVKKLKQCHKPYTIIFVNKYPLFDVPGKIVSTALCLQEVWQKMYHKHHFVVQHL